MKQEFLVKGLHCKSCEILIEEKLSGKKEVKKAEVVLAENKLKIESKKKISVEKLNKWFEGSEYSFGTSPLKRETLKDNWWILGVMIVAGLFVLLSKIGWTRWIDINNESSWVMLFLFGLVAGFSSCGALLSGMIIGFGKEKYWWSVRIGGRKNNFGWMGKLVNGRSVANYDNDSIGNVGGKVGK